MKKNRKVWLSVAAAEDIADMIVQENIYLSFIKNEGKTIGKGPTAFTKKMNERKAERLCRFSCGIIEDDRYDG